MIESMAAVLFYIFIVEGAAYYWEQTNLQYKNAKGKMVGSNLKLYIDPISGVHYLKAGLFGSLVVRLDKDGKPYTGEKND